MLFRSNVLHALTMPKQGRRGDTTKVSFHFIWSASLTAGAAVVQVSPSGLSTLSTRMLVEADSWDYFRLLNFKFRVHPSNASANQAVAFAPVSDTAPSTLGQCMECMASAYIDAQQTVPTEWVVVPQADLKGPFPWYKAINGTPDTTEETPAVIQVIGTGTDTFAVEFRCEVEFKSSLATGNTPEEVELARRRLALRKKLAVDHARAAMLGVLAPAAAVTGVTAAVSSIPK